MKVITNLGSLFAVFLKRLNLCSIVGFTAGGLSGILLTVYGVLHGGISISMSEILYLTILLTLYSFFIIFIFLWGFVKMRINSFIVGVLINCFLTVGLTVLATNNTILYLAAWLAGMLIGIFVGLILCWLNSVFNKNIKYGLFR